MWSGYPELAPFYEHVAEGMKAEFPDLSVRVEAIALREHEKRIALGLTSGEAAEVIELGTSTATRYLENELFNAAPENVAAFVQDPANFNEFFRDSASYKGAVYGMPLFRGQSALYYNTEMFKAAGLTTPPATMADYTTYAETLTQRDASGNPTVSGWSMRLSGGGQGIAEKFWINMFQYDEQLVEQRANGRPILPTKPAAPRSSSICKTFTRSRRSPSRCRRTPKPSSANRRRCSSASPG